MYPLDDAKLRPTLACETRNRWGLNDAGTNGWQSPAQLACNYRYFSMRALATTALAERLQLVTTSLQGMLVQQDGGHLAQAKSDANHDTLAIELTAGAPSPEGMLVQQDGGHQLCKVINKLPVTAKASCEQRV